LTTSSDSRTATAASEIPANTYIGIGTNLGDRARNLHDALSLLGNVVRVQRVSGIYETDPVGYADQPRFWNLVAQVATDLAPEKLLEQLIAVEQQMGRTRSFRNAPRIIDLDILLYGDVVLDVPGLTLPHPRMSERAFVLKPLIELNPDLHHPITRVRFRDILDSGEFERADRVGSVVELGL
jgi:2-amino-4-hydroxy-6-hydroxymethyldihydropteridine diphosphokinase